MNSLKRRLYISILLALFIACKKNAITEGGNGLGDWTAATHGFGATPNYGVVFNQNEVLRLDFVIPPEYWEAMQNNLATIYANTSIGEGGGGDGGGGGLVTETPIYVPVQMSFKGKQWYDVGLRYKGNSSLQTAYINGSGKLPFRIEMDHFANGNSNSNGQTFYGFTQLALSSNFNDNSIVHEKVAADVFRDFGVPAPQSAFYRVYVDYGKGPTYFGLYTILEVVFDPSMLNAQFGSSDGNCYKPDGAGAHLNNLAKIDGASFPNKTNDEASLDDMNALVTALLADTRTSNPSQWRTELEKILNVDQYLKYLAANTTMTNWDTYGISPHNFYLYNDPSDNKLVWIPWDNNQMFESASPNGPLDFDFSNLAITPLAPGGEVSWPMITYIYNDPVYKTQYDQYIDEFITTTFTYAKMSSRFTNATHLIQPYVTGAYGEQPGYTNLTSRSDFDNALSGLLNTISKRIMAAADYTP